MERHQVRVSCLYSEAYSEKEKLDCALFDYPYAEITYY